MSDSSHNTDSQDTLTISSRSSESASQPSSGDFELTQNGNHLDELASGNPSPALISSIFLIDKAENNQMGDDTSIASLTSISNISDPRRFAIGMNGLLAPHVFVELRQRNQLGLLEIKRIAQKDLATAYLKIRDLSDSIIVQNRQLETAYLHLYGDVQENDARLQMLRGVYRDVKKELIETQKGFKNALELNQIKENRERTHQGERSILQQLIRDYETKLQAVTTENVTHSTTSWNDAREIKKLLKRNEELVSLLLELQKTVDQHENTIYDLEQEIVHTADFLEVGLRMSQGLTDRLRNQTIEAARTRLSLDVDTQTEVFQTPPLNPIADPDCLRTPSELNLNQEGIASDSNSQQSFHYNQNSVRRPSDLQHPVTTEKESTVETDKDINAVIGNNHAEKVSLSDLEPKARPQPPTDSAASNKRNISPIYVVEKVETNSGDPETGVTDFDLSDQSSVSSRDSIIRTDLRLKSGRRKKPSLNTVHSTLHSDVKTSSTEPVDVPKIASVPVLTCHPGSLSSSKSVHDVQQPEIYGTKVTDARCSDIAASNGNSTDGVESCENFTISSYASSSYANSDNELSSCGDSTEEQTQDSDYEEESIIGTKPVPSQNRPVGDVQSFVLEQASSDRQSDTGLDNSRLGAVNERHSKNDQDTFQKPIPLPDPANTDQMALDIGSAIEAQASRKGSSVSLSTAGTEAGLEAQLDRAIASQKATGQIHLSSKPMKRKEMLRTNSAASNTSKIPLKTQSVPQQTASRSHNIKPGPPNPVVEVNGSVEDGHVLDIPSGSATTPDLMNAISLALDSAKPTFRAVSYTSSSTLPSQDASNNDISASSVSPLTDPHVEKSKQPQQDEKTAMISNNSSIEIQNVATQKEEASSDNQTQDLPHSLKSTEEVISEPHIQQDMSVDKILDGSAYFPCQAWERLKRWLKRLINRIAGFLRYLIGILYPSGVTAWLSKFRASILNCLIPTTTHEITFTVVTLPLASIVTSATNATKSLKSCSIWLFAHVITLACTLYLAHSLYQARQFWYTANTTSTRAQIMSWREDRWEWTPIVYMRWYLEMYIDNLYKGHNLLLV